METSKKEQHREKLPILVPTVSRFEEAIAFIEAPLRAISESLVGINSRANRKDQAIGDTIELFLEQLHYILMHSEVEGTNIMHAEIMHSFRRTQLEGEKLAS